MVIGGPAQANSLQAPISKTTRVKWTRGVAREVKYLHRKYKALSSNSCPTYLPKNPSNLFLTVLKAGKSMIKTVMWVEAFLCHPHVARCRREKKEQTVCPDMVSRKQNSLLKVIFLAAFPQT
jgi:hypothetical protein